MVSGEQVQAVIADLGVAEEVIDETGIFCISQINPMFGESYSGPIPVYRIPGCIV
jgi:hypothetical protein